MKLSLILISDRRESLRLRVFLLCFTIFALPTYADQNSAEQFEQLEVEMDGEKLANFCLLLTSRLNLDQRYKALMLYNCFNPPLVQKNSVESESAFLISGPELRSTVAMEELYCIYAAPQIFKDNELSRALLNKNRRFRNGNHAEIANYIELKIAKTCRLAATDMGILHAKDEYYKLLKYHQRTWRGKIDAQNKNLELENQNRDLKARLEAALSNKSARPSVKRQLNTSCATLSRSNRTSGPNIYVDVTNNCGECVHISSNTFLNGSGIGFAGTWSNVQPSEVRTGHYSATQIGRYEFRVVLVETCQ